jgi:hypothetical protein
MHYTNVFSILFSFFFFLFLGALHKLNPSFRRFQFACRGLPVLRLPSLCGVFVFPWLVVLKVRFLFAVRARSFVPLEHIPVEVFVDELFGPVTWHHQRRPLRPRLGLQNKKDPPEVGRRSLLRRLSQSSVCMKWRERVSSRGK